MELPKRVTNNSGFNNLKYLCRVCLKDKRGMMPLNANIEKRLEENVSLISEALTRVTKITIQTGMQCPSYICPACLELLNTAYKFILQFEESQKLLEEYCSNDLLGKGKALLIVEIDGRNEVIPVQVTTIIEQPKIEVVQDKPPDIIPDIVDIPQNLNIEEPTSSINNEVEELLDLNHSIPSLETELNNLVCEPNASDESSSHIDNNDCQKIKIQCDKCNRSFARKSSLKRHEEVIHHHKPDTYVCEICGAYLKSRSSRYLHMRKHNGKGRKKCHICHKFYFNSSTLLLHIKAIHNNERQHLCAVCGKSFNYSNALNYHMRIHSSEKNYKCVYCDKAFTMQCTLSRHLRIHTGNRPYHCKYCDKAFKSKGEVDCHEMSHTGFRPYHCKYCNKGFTKTHNLKTHLFSHTGDYECKICNKSFIEVSILKIHIKSSHSVPGTSEEVMSEVDDGDEDDSFDVKEDAVAEELLSELKF